MVAVVSRWIALLLLIFANLVPTRAAQDALPENPTRIEVQLKTWIAAQGAAPDRAALLRFYSVRSWTLAWRQPLLASLARAALSDAPRDGLSAGKYRFTEVPDEPVRNDVTLTLQLLRYAHDLSQGLTHPDNGTTAGDPAPDLGADLARASRTPPELQQFLAGLPPDHPEYQTLKQAYAHYLSLAARGGWSRLPAVHLIELSADRALAQLVRARLAIEVPALHGADVAELKAAIPRFQTQLGLSPDGVIGPKTIAALNIQPAQRAAQLAANMERWRWLPHRFPARYIEVNAANATLKAVDHGVVVVQSRVITGKRSTPTPQFTSMAFGVIVNPVWEVPQSIIRQEILPHLRHRPDYLARNHMIMRNGRVQQMPGDNNALGRIKVEMSDPFDVYLHDTPAKILFARDQRHMSHGCIRVQKILPLASWLLTGDVAKGLDLLHSTIAEGATRRIAAEKPVAIYVGYWTAVAQDNGSVDFVPDIYQRDGPVIGRLAGASP